MIRMETKIQPYAMVPTTTPSAQPSTQSPAVPNETTNNGSVLSAMTEIDTRRQLSIVAANINALITRVNQESGSN